jgi:hypothetical protein
MAWRGAAFVGNPPPRGSKRRVALGLADGLRFWRHVRRDPPREAAGAPRDGLGCCVRPGPTRLAQPGGARRRVRSCWRCQRHGPAKGSRTGTAACLRGGYAGKDESKSLGRSIVMSSGLCITRTLLKRGSLGCDSRRRSCRQDKELRQSQNSRRDLRGNSAIRPVTGGALRPMTGTSRSQ